MDATAVSSGYLFWQLLLLVLMDWYVFHCSGDQIDANTLVGFVAGG